MTEEQAERLIRVLEEIRDRLPRPVHVTVSPGAGGGGGRVTLQRCSVCGMSFLGSHICPRSTT